MSKQSGISRTLAAVGKQIAAMESEQFDIGVQRSDGTMLLREGLTVEQIVNASRWLRHENAEGAHIYVRPAGCHALSLIDDLDVAAICRMKESGFEPALVVETSPRNFQAWLNHGQSLDHHRSTYASKQLARRFGGDPSSADWRHFGRLAGFTNPKPARRLPSGLPPFVQLRESEGCVYGEAAQFLERVTAIAEIAARKGETKTQSQFQPRDELPRSPADFHRVPRYSGDLHRADLAWAIYAASRGLSQQQITQEILHARDLSKKGVPARQFDYAERTAIKALAAAKARD